ncbi:plasmid pRiA4b ORF-3 family protein [Sporosarcina gallistercoris]|uniref:plasmid pRiA4b ORF-3 family protein n=1 Tax=Sporosarcina gallistercoris TaxID=2762245 RepID=UPI003D2DB977
MEIHGTKKLLDAISFSIVTEYVEREPLFSWHANLLVMNRRKTLVLMNDQNRYTVVLHGLKAKDFKRLDELIVEAIRETLKAENIGDDVIELYIKVAGAVTFHKSKNRSFVAQLNKSCDHVWFGLRGLDPDELISTNVAKQVSRLLVGKANHEMNLPYEELFNDLTKLSGKEIFQTDVAVLKVTMPFEDVPIWRRVLVPLSCSFETMHEILQILFDWHDSHMHEFILFDENETDESQSKYSPTFTKQHYRPMLRVVMKEESLEMPGDLPIKLEKNITLAGIVETHTVVKYMYDFGDGWMHDIQVEKVLHDQTISKPVCLEGEGTAPPEDCGGEPGFYKFLEIMKNPSSPENETMKSWARGQLYREFDLDVVNRRLRSL